MTVLCLCCLCAAASAQQQVTAGALGKPTFTTFDSPGVTSPVAGEGTFPASINAVGTIAGAYDGANASPELWGFVRSAGGAITDFGAPDPETVNTYAVGINAMGTIAGYYAAYTALPTQGGYILFHGLVRAADGTLTTFDAPGAGANEGQGTFAAGINGSGAITGYYIDGNNTVHGYVRTDAGVFTSFDAPGAGTTGSGGTFPQGIANTYAIAGYYVDASGVYHGFVRAYDDARIVTFDAPRAGTAARQGTQAWGINLAGAVVGYCIDSGFLYHGFVRAPNGTIATFSAPAARVTFAVGINDAGTVVGSYSRNDVSHGFVRSANGTITTFNAPGAGYGSGQGTFAARIDRAGAIVGSFVDASGLSHGFLLQ
jgi:hypothetical protein